MRSLVGTGTPERSNTVVRNAGQFRNRVIRQHLRRHGTEGGLRNYVAGKCGAGYCAISADGRRPWIVDGSVPFAEVALQHLRGGKSVESGELPAPDVELIERHEEERTVAALVYLRYPDGSAEGE